MSDTTPTWEQHGEAILNRAAHWVLAEATRIGTWWHTIEAGDPIVGDGMKLIEAEAVKRGVPVDQIEATEGDLLSTVKAVATATDTPSVPVVPAPTPLPAPTVSSGTSN